jgi:large subunit ribosomal protein L37Ae
MLRTQKFGARLRKLVVATERSKKTKYECPRCGKKKVVRKSNAVWQCRSCDSKFTGGAYSLNTEAGEIMLRSVKGYASS